MNDAAMRDQFESSFPEWASKLRSATTQDQILEIQDQLLAECRENLRLALEEATVTQGSVLPLLRGTDVPSVSDPIPLDPDKVQRLIDARGDRIHVEIQQILDGLERTKNLGATADQAIVALQLMGFGAVGIGTLAGGVVFDWLMTNMAVAGADALLEAVMAGVAAVGTAIVVAVAALIVVVVLFPIIYFMVKEAICIIFLINELTDRDLFLEDTYDVHGKPVLVTERILAAHRIPDKIGGKLYAYGGLFDTKKRTDAFYGTQFGFVMSDRNDKTIPPTPATLKLAFATECPLNGVNNCYCSFDESAESAARKTAKEKQEFSTVTKDGVTLSMRCNSKSGGVAWYVARVYREPKS